MSRKQITVVLALAGLAPLAQAQCVPQWTALPASAWLDDEVKALHVWQEVPGSTPVLVATGNFLTAGNSSQTFIGLWNGQQWSPMAQGLTGSGTCLAMSSGPRSEPKALYAGGIGLSVGGQPIASPVQWSGSAWQTLGGAGITGGTFPTIQAIEWFNSSLYIGGVFQTVGGQPIRNFARWDGSAWHAVDTRWQDSSFKSLIVHEGQLFAGGAFYLNGSLPNRGVVKLNGSQLDPVDGAPFSKVHVLGSYQGKLIAGGSFSSIWNPGQPGEFIAAWDGTAWSSLGSGMNGNVEALCAFDPDGAGPLPEYLIASGLFTTAGGVPANRIAAWDGSQWMPMGSGINGEVLALAVYQNQLYVGGYFTTAGGLQSPYLARWGCPPLPCYANCDGSTRTPALTANDFMCFLNKYAAADPSANCDNSTTSPTLTANDFACFLNQYAAGCP